MGLRGRALPLLGRALALLVLPVAASAASDWPAPGERRVSFDAAWRFQKGDAAGAEKPGFADGGWRVLDLPHDWAIEGPFDPKISPHQGSLPFFGVAWYRKRFTVPESARGRYNSIEIDGAMSNATVFLNGPSQVFLSAYKDETIGSMVVPTLEGNRPLLVEIQALTTSNNFAPPRRIANGVDFNRLLLIIAVLTKRAGLKLFNQDIIVNVTGGLRVNEPAIDLGIALAIASSFRETRPVSGLVALGELGLNGELRGVSQLERRIGESIRLGFKSCLVPALRARPSSDMTGVRLIQAGSVAEALRLGLAREGKKEIISLGPRLDHHHPPAWA